MKTGGEKAAPPAPTPTAGFAGNRAFQRSSKRAIRRNARSLKDFPNPPESTMLFRLDGAGKEFSGQWLLKGIAVQCNRGDRIGLIGPNGAGKTTLLNLIEERWEPDEGRILRASGISFARVEQAVEFGEETSVLQEALSVFSEIRGKEARLRAMEREMAKSGAEGRSPPADVAEEYDRLRHSLRVFGGYDYEARAKKVLQGLGLTPDLFDRPGSRLSGGQQSRLLLARALLRPADVILLDEPTNHLDLHGIFWLAEFLSRLETAFIVISHDRHFLDRVTQRTWEIERCRLFEYPAPYSRARRLRKERIRLETQAYRQQQEWKHKTEEFVRRNIVGQKTKQAQSRRHQLEKTEWLEDPEPAKAPLHLRIPEAPRGNALMLRAEGLSVGYAKDRPVLQGVDLELARGRRMGLLGGNGSGKSTLLKTLLGQLPPLQGRFQWGEQAVLGYFSQQPEWAFQGETVFQCLTELDPSGTDQEIRDLGARFLFRGDEIYKPVESLSGGERSRLELARLFFRPVNCLLLDEPTNHLDIESRQVLEEALDRFSGAVLVVSHDFYFMEKVAETFLLARDGGLQEFRSLAELAAEVAETSYEDRDEEASKPSTPPPDSRRREGLSKNELWRRQVRVQQLEERIEELEDRKSELRNSIERSGSNHVRLAQLAVDLEELEKKLQAGYAEWEQAVGELGEQEKGAV